MKRRRLYIILTAPLEVVGCAIVGCYRGAMDGVENIIHAWRLSRWDHGSG